MSRSILSPVRAFAARHRILISRLYFLPVIALILATRGTFADSGKEAVLVDLAAFAAITVAALGRLWCSIYIAGYKTCRVIDCGPYSLVRNPLYLFSLIGGVGAGLATHSLVVLALVLGFFAVVYPMTIADEERRLEAVHGEPYLAYKAHVPRLVPRVDTWQAPVVYAVNLPRLQHAFLDTVWFFWMFAALFTLHRVQASEVVWTLMPLP